MLDPTKPITLTLWHYYSDENQKALENAIATFNQTIGIDRGVIVDPISKGKIAELEAAVTDSALGLLGSEPMPDLFSSYPDKAIELDKLGKLTDLAPHFTHDELDLYVEGFMTDGIDESGRFLVFPIVKSTELMCVNKTDWQVFAEVKGYTIGDLSSWDGIYDIAKQYYKWSGGKAFLGIDSPGNFIIIASKQLGLDIIDSVNKQAVLDKKIMRQIFDFYYKGMAMGYLRGGNTFGSDDIKKNIIVAYLGSSASAAYFPTWVEKNNVQTPIDLLALPYPVFEHSQPYVIQQGAGMCVANSSPQRQEAAILFLKWFTDIDQNIDFAMTTGYLPVRKMAYENDQLNAALEKLHGGELSHRNIATIYETALKQTLQKNTYAPKAFKGSYGIRRILQSTLLDMVNEGRTTAAAFKNQDPTQDETLKELDMDAQFELWLSNVQNEFDQSDIPYIKQ